MMSTDDADFDPFNAPLDPERDQEILIRSLQTARDFVLLFAVTNSATERDRRMDAVASQLPGKKIQRVAVSTETYNLLWHLREVLDNPRPDVVFVYGLENWISGVVNPRSIPFLLNLNAARDSYPGVLPAPMVLWVPQYVLNAIANAAPDFFSVRSGVYTFPISHDELHAMYNTLTNMDYTEVIAHPVAERVKRTQELEGLLAEYGSLPEPQRDIRSEAKLMRSLAEQLYSDGRLSDAEEHYTKVLKIARNMLPDILTGALNDIGVLYYSQQRFSEAETSFQEAIEIARGVIPINSPNLSGYLNHLGKLYRVQGRHEDAENLFLEALKNDREVQPRNSPLISRRLNDLAVLYFKQERFDEAEILFLEAVNIDRTTLPDNHPSLARHLKDLALLYRAQGRYVEAMSLFHEAIDIVGKSIGNYHPTAINILEDYNNFIVSTQAK